MSSRHQLALCPCLFVVTVRTRKAKTRPRSRSVPPSALYPLGWSASSQKLQRRLTSIVPLDSQLIYETVPPGEYWIVASTSCHMPFKLRSPFRSHRYLLASQTDASPHVALTSFLRTLLEETDSIAHFERCQRAVGVDFDSLTVD
jgi:hypothetical protein